MPERVFGEIPGYSEGHIFESRQELSSFGIHRPRQAGISGSQNEGADSIVLSGGYIDDQDLGDVIIFTGHGGRDPYTSQQISDQLLTQGNKALAKSCTDGLPVRVVRGFGHRSPYSPKYGYRYDGLYRVESFWRDTGRNGFNIWRFRLEKLQIFPSAYSIGELSGEYDADMRTEILAQRIIRDTAIAKAIKELHNYQCQVCGIRLAGSAGPYAESAHIRPLGSPHNGADVPGNILCVCPNHHVMLDYGGFAIADDLKLIGLDGELSTVKNHTINIDNIRYHRQHFYGFI